MRFRITFSFLIAASGLAACGPVNRGLESAHQPVVSRTDYVYDLPDGDLSVTDQQRLAAWFDSIRLDYGDRVAIDDHRGYGYDVGTRDAVAKIVARYGLLLDKNAPVTAGSANVAGVRVVVSRGQAKVGKCPDWDRPSQPEFAASTMSNYGCAVNTNLAAMVANPEDLVRGHPGQGSDADSAVKGIRSYRDAPPTGKNGLKTESSQ